MIPISTATSSGLSWSKNRRGFELSRNGDVVGSLQRTSFWSCSFQAQTSNGTWMFRRRGFFGTRLEVVGAGSGQNVATFDGGWSSGGTLEFSDGTMLRLRREGFWRPVWSVSGPDGQEMVRLHIREKTVEPVAGTLSDDRLALTIFVVLYRMWQADQDGAAVAAVVAATG